MSWNLRKEWKDDGQNNILNQEDLLLFFLGKAENAGLLLN